jgi:hypothetical protein
LKEDLKRSVSDFFYCVFVHLFTILSTRKQPLHCTEAGEGKSDQDVEKYLEGLLQAICQVDPVPVSGRSRECGTISDALSMCEHPFALFLCEIMN